jgi:hypothetical protein
LHLAGIMKSALTGFGKKQVSSDSEF